MASAAAEVIACCFALLAFVVASEAAVTIASCFALFVIAFWSSVDGVQSVVLFPYSSFNLVTSFVPLHASVAQIIISSFMF